MHAVSRSSARRRALVTLLVVAALGIGVVDASPAIAGNGYRSTVLRLINQSRERHGLRDVRLRGSLAGEARKHSRKMIRQNRVFDPPNLRQILAPYRWTHLGAATAGCDDTLRQLHRALMRSSVHRGILLNPHVRRVGIGIVRSDQPNACGRNSFWVTEIFYG
jgi:uncharacterized protein YkwD